MTVRPIGISLLLGMCTLGLSNCSTQPAGTEMLPDHEMDLSHDTAAWPISADPQRNSVPAPVAAWEPTAYRPWRYIVVHHSASLDGNATIFDKWHRARGWDGLGYHFVIDNGNGGPDGRVEVGRRWRIQKWGAHTGGTPDNEYNNYGIGICLVGNFDVTAPTPSQLASLRKLVNFLALRYGIAPDHIIGHRDAPNAHTSCPGNNLWRYVHTELRGEVARVLAAK